MFKFLPGLLLLQLVTAGLVILCLSRPLEPQLITIIVGFALILAVLTTFWFGSIARNVQNATMVKLQEKHAQDREKIIRKAEREKAKLTSKSYQQIEKATQKAHAKANFKVGASFTAAIAVGGVMIFSQLVTVGMMVMIGSGSALAGYLIRARQDHLAWKKRLAPQATPQTSTKQIEAKNIQAKKRS